MHFFIGGKIRCINTELTPCVLPALLVELFGQKLSLIYSAHEGNQNSSRKVGKGINLRDGSCSGVGTPKNPFSLRSTFNKAYLRPKVKTLSFFFFRVNPWDIDWSKENWLQIDFLGLAFRAVYFLKKEFKASKTWHQTPRFSSLGIWQMWFVSFRAFPVVFSSFVSRP